jgi:DNA adenine methylase
MAAPVLKWAGGKRQLLPLLVQRYPTVLLQGEIDTYIEPFVGGGAVFFDLAQRRMFRQAYLFDVNPAVVGVYTAIRDQVEDVIALLTTMGEMFLNCNSLDRSAFFYKMRETYNTQPGDTLTKAAQTLFLNKTCFNGLYRVNSKGQFNVPYGQYKQPGIVQPERLRAVSMALQGTVIQQGDFSHSVDCIKGKTFIYYDPPYRPLNKTSFFNQYDKTSFDDKEQSRLAAMFKELDKNGVLQMLSNADPTNTRDDPFFDQLYAGYCIERITATRRINADAGKRGGLREILVRNYTNPSATR